MANTQAIAKSFRVDLLNGIHAFGTSVVRAGTGEATCNYTAGGVTLTNATAPANTGGTNIVAFWTPSANAAWTALTSSGAFDCALLYNSTHSNKAIAAFTFGSQNVTSGNFTLTMPTNDLTTGLIRIA